jgi:hypothetical protein
LVVVVGLVWALMSALKFVKEMLDLARDKGCLPFPTMPNSVSNHCKAKETPSKLRVYSQLP